MSAITAWLLLNVSVHRSTQVLVLVRIDRQVQVGPVVYQPKKCGSFPRTLWSTRLLYWSLPPPTLAFAVKLFTLVNCIARTVGVCPQIRKHFGRRIDPVRGITLPGNCWRVMISLPLASLAQGAFRSGRTLSADRRSESRLRCVSHVGKVAATHGIGRNRIHVRNALAKPESLPAEEEERLVLHRSARRRWRRTGFARTQDAAHRPCC